MASAAIGKLELRSVPGLRGRSPVQSDRLFRARSRRSHARGSRAALEFAKYHGLGNDFILLDNRESHDLAITSEEAKKLCDRSFGVGADGVILATPPFDGTGSQYGMRIFNADGSEAEMCGNGIRCLARFVAGKDGGRRGEVSVSTLAGEMKPTLLADDRVAVDMGPPSLQPGDIPTTLAATTPAGNVVQSPLDGYLVTAVGMGNPHAVIFSTEDGAELNVDSLDLERIGPPLENHDAFPSRANVEFVSVISDNHLRMRVWERGSGQTLACGTGACAVAVAGHLEGRCGRKSVVELPGGPLEIEWQESTGHVIMTGPAQAVFSGSLDSDFIRS